MGVDQPKWGLDPFPVDDLRHEFCTSDCAGMLNEHHKRLVTCLDEAPEFDKKDTLKFDIAHPLQTLLDACATRGTSEVRTEAEVVSWTIYVAIPVIVLIILCGGGWLI